MTGDQPRKPGPLTPAALERERVRAERRARALRDNLKRRKQQSTARSEAAGGGAETAAALPAGALPAGDDSADPPSGPAGERR